MSFHSIMMKRKNIYQIILTWKPTWSACAACTKEFQKNYGRKRLSAVTCWIGDSHRIPFSSYSLDLSDFTFLIALIQQLASESYMINGIHAYLSNPSSRSRSSIIRIPEISSSTEGVSVVGKWTTCVSKQF